MRTLRETAVELRVIAAETRNVADRVIRGGAGIERWAIARDLTTTAHTIDMAADVAERTGRAAGEPPAAAQSVVRWVTDAFRGVAASVDVALRGES